MPVDLPESLQLLIAELTGSGGMTETRRHYDKAFGNCLIDLESDSLCIRMVRDRSQWFVSVDDPRRPGRWYDVDELRRLDGDGPARSPVPIEDQARFIRDRLSVLREAFSASSRTNTHRKLAAYSKSGD